MQRIISWASLALAVVVMSFSMVSSAADGSTTTEAAAADCKTVACFKALLRGPAGPPGPPGPRGPAGQPGRAMAQDVYAGAYRMGRLIGLDVATQCSPFYPNFSLQTFEVGLIGLVETSTGYLVHLCIGVKFPAGDVGAGLGAIPSGSPYGSSEFPVFYKGNACDTAPYAVIKSATLSEVDFGGNGEFGAGEYRGIFGPLMGKPRAVIIPNDKLGLQGQGRKFYIPGPVELFAAQSLRPYANNCESSLPGYYRQPAAFVEIKPNDPSVTGLPDAPETPYTLRDVTY